LSLLRQLCWSYGVRWSDEAHASLRGDNRLDTDTDVPGIILYPSLLAPALSLGAATASDAHDVWLELLVLGPESLPPARVNRQLKVVPWDDASPTFYDRPLLGDLVDPSGSIFVQRAGDFAADTPLATSGATARFKGLLSPHFVDAWKDALRDDMLHVRFRDALAPYAPPKTPKRALLLVAVKLVNALRALATVHRVRVDRRALMASPQEGARAPEHAARPVDLQTLLLQAVLRRIHEKRTRTTVLFAKARFAALAPELLMEVVSDDAGRALHDQRSAQPVRSLHPWFELDRMAWDTLRVGHATDLHINVRLDLLRRSLARVVSGASSTTPSARIGDKITLTTRNVVSVIDGLVRGGANLLLLGGDNIDHVRNAWAPALLGDDGPSRRTREVWDAVAVGDADDGRYQPYVDSLAFYGIVRRGLGRWRVPAFGVSGNHDFYLDPYGLTPTMPGIGPVNEGIPGDVNLTPYEAKVLFGDTSNSIGPAWIRKGSAVLAGQPDQLRWYHSVFNPFSDFKVETPTHPLVALGWGDAESLLLHHESGLTHLPVATESVTPAQKALLQGALSTGRRAVVLTHFTFASYHDSIPRTDPTGTVAASGNITADRVEQLDDPSGTIGSMTHAYHATQFGTFDLARAGTYGLCRDPARVAAVFSGHSHRRGLYYIGPQDGWHFPSRMKPFDDAAIAVDPAAESAPFIQSDSAGPYPRLNRRGEFEGWGSARPSGTLAVFDTNARLKEVRAVSAACAAPRLAVALAFREYIGLNNHRGVFRRFALVRDSRSVSGSRGGTAYLVADLREGVRLWGVRLTSLVLHTPPARGEAAAATSSSLQLRPARLSASALASAFALQPDLAMALLGLDERPGAREQDPLARDLLERNALWEVQCTAGLKGWEAAGAGRFASIGVKLETAFDDAKTDYDAADPWDVELYVEPRGRPLAGSDWWVYWLGICNEPDYESRKRGDA
jgi:Calcineurin-like phosphoesterase